MSMYVPFSLVYPFSLILTLFCLFFHIFKVYFWVHFNSCKVSLTFVSTLTIWTENYNCSFSIIMVFSLFTLFLLLSVSLSLSLSLSLCDSFSVHLSLSHHFSVLLPILSLCRNISLTHLHIVLLCAFISLFLQPSFSFGSLSLSLSLSPRTWTFQPWNTNWKGRLSTIDLLIKIPFCKKYI
jgi:hypothetical protein